MTNDFPPKVGGIQSYLWELWRRLPPAETTVLTTPHRGSAEFDAAQLFRIERTRDPVLLPHPWLARHIDSLAKEISADVVILDPALPLGLLGRSLKAAPHLIVVHGAEIGVPRRVPGARELLRSVLGSAAGVIAAGEYPANQAAQAADARLARPLPVITVPCGVDVMRFRPIDDEARNVARNRLGLPQDAPLILGLSRLVPRKGFDTLIAAVAKLEPEVHLVIAGTGRDRERLVRQARGRGVSERVHFLGRVNESDLADLYGCADVFAMLCRDRWGGLEAEGFGIVFLEAQACGTPVVAGRSGGAHEAVEEGQTGFVVDPLDASAAAGAIEKILADPDRRRAMGIAARKRAVEHFSYDYLIEKLLPVTRGDFGGLVEHFGDGQ